jgi:predicted HTH transcriptional regulator
MIEISLQLKRYISEGEHLRQDFKETITSSYKIAKTISAYANTDGGRILIGIRDNGAIRGIQPEEEKHLMEIAANLYCSPPVKLHYEEIPCGNKKVLLVEVPRATENLVGAKDETDGKFWVYTRWKDTSVIASKIHMEILRRKMNNVNSLLQFGEKEKTLLNFLEKNDFITLKAYTKLAHIPFWKAQKILINFVCGGVIGIEPNSGVDRFYLINKEHNKT